MDTDVINMSYGEVGHSESGVWCVCTVIRQPRLAGNTVSVRALAAVMEAGADVINMSYGEVRHFQSDMCRVCTVFGQLRLTGHNL
jgi:chloramphenicol 3-O-phosphotransferase